MVYFLLQLVASFNSNKQRDLVFFFLLREIHIFLKVNKFFGSPGVRDRVSDPE